MERRFRIALVFSVVGPLLLPAWPAAAARPRWITTGSVHDARYYHTATPRGGNTPSARVERGAADSQTSWTDAQAVLAPASLFTPAA